MIRNASTPGTSGNIDSPATPGQPHAPGGKRAAVLPEPVVHDLQVENELYLRKHPEIKLLTSYFLKRCLLDSPRDIATYAAGLFADPALPEKVALSAPKYPPQ
ncbi:hypothetical protein H9P43_003998 [Blastocladiella emersonii ATCC 22665]|nr:hypothetical protein H9P43_003998 [Blastocladiella emersonii ATCC 22665]